MDNRNELFDSFVNNLRLPTKKSCYCTSLQIFFIKLIRTVAGRECLCRSKIIYLPNIVLYVIDDYTVNWTEYMYRNFVLF